MKARNVFLNELCNGARNLRADSFTRTLSLATLCLLLLPAVGCHRGAASTGGLTKVSIGIQVSPAMTLLMVAKDEGFFEREGVEVDLKQFTAGKFALQAFFAGSIDYAVSGEVPVCLAALGGNESRVVTQVVARTNDEVRIVARKDPSSSDAADGKAYFIARKRKVATSFGGGPEFFTYNFLQHNGIAPAQVELISQRPEDMPASLASKSVDAISIFDPFAYIAEKQLGTQAVTFRASELYSELYVLVAHPKQLDRDSATIQALMRAMQDAADFTAKHPDQAKQILQKYTKLDAGTVDGVWGSFDFHLALTPQLVADWNAEAKWAKSTGKVSPQTPVPDFTTYVEPRFLKAVSPNSVKVQ